MTPAFALALSTAYVIGSFPSAYIAGRLAKGVDLRRVGSGNLGATNVYREVGAAAAVCVLLIDAAKGWVAVTQVPHWFPLIQRDWTGVSLGAMAVLGHAKPIFLGWKGGGKGVATGAGVFLGLAPLALAIAVAVFSAIVALTRYVSAASIAAAIVLPIAIGMVQGVTAVFIMSVAICAFVVWSHRANMRRLLHGQEARIGRPGAGTHIR